MELGGRGPLLPGNPGLRCPLIIEIRSIFTCCRRPDSLWLVSIARSWPTWAIESCRHNQTARARRTRRVQEEADLDPDVAGVLLITKYFLGSFGNKAVPGKIP